MAITESLTFANSTLPEFNGSLDVWNQDVINLHGAVSNPEGYLFEAQLPEVVGSLTFEERDVLENSTSLSMDYNPAKAGFNYFAQVLPYTYGVILDDMTKVGPDSARLKRIEIDKKLVQQGTTPRGLGWHTDGMVRDPKELSLPSYLISSKGPTEFYRGPARSVMLGNHLVLDKDSLGNKPDSIVTALPYDIVRISWATVHRSPEADQEYRRIFMRLVSAIK